MHFNLSIIRAIFTGAAALLALPASAAPVSYRQDIEPFFAATCASCHSADKHSSGFVVDTPEALLRGGAKSGAKVVVAGSPAQSRLLAYLRGQVQPRMPLNGKPIDPAQIAKIAAWIQQGARIDAIKPVWPYTPPAASALPKVKNSAWCASPIDRFVLAKLEARGLHPAPPAPRIALLRRVYADLIGVPPTPEETAAFLKDRRPTAYAEVVDRLLADPRYGERWARHWLDLVRYADSDGFEADSERPRAWRYRDYVIRSFNEDKPYDRFVKEQLAGDELFPDDPQALVATGFARLGPWDALSTDPPQRWQDYLNDATDTAGSVFLGLTVGCARCHNHKYDRISQADYYRLQAFFTQTDRVARNLPHPESDPQQIRIRYTAAHEQLLGARKKMDALRTKVRAELQAKKPGTQVSDKDVEGALENAYRQDRDRVNDEIRRWESEDTAVGPAAEVIADKAGAPSPSHLLLRGNLQTPGPEVKPGFVAALDGGKESDAVIAPRPGTTSTGRRAALANWIASSSNAMTARVIVNRLWQHHFGIGIVGTPSDFGRNGEAATHRELLDWLAIQFVRDGWSIKKMHRRMLLSSVYQESTQFNAVSAKADPENHLLWRMNRLRLEGEALRDSILAASGRLNLAAQGPGVFPRVSEEVLSSGSTHKWGSSPEADQLRRSIYVFQRRSLALPILEVFDGADVNNTCPRRSRTTIAPQALAMFNSEFAQTESKWLAKRIGKEAGPTPEARVDRAYLITLSRLPTPAQRARAIAFMNARAKLVGASKTAPEPDAPLAAFCHVLINSNEFLYLD